MFTTRSSHLFIFAFAAILGPACSSDGDNPVVSGDRKAQVVPIEFDQSVVMPSSVLQFRLVGTDRVVASEAEVSFEGGSVSESIIVAPADGFRRTLGDQGDIVVEVPVEDGLWSTLGVSGDATFDGTIEVAVRDEIGDAALGDIEVSLDFQSDATLSVDEVASGVHFLNEGIVVTGSNFLRPEEGNSWAILNGTYALVEGGERSIDGRVPIRWTGSRTQAEMVVDPGVFGVRLGSFTGSVEFENELRTGQSFPGNLQNDLSIEILETFLASISPDEGSRGQKVTFAGRGFIPTVQTAEQTYGMVFIYDGVFTYDAGGELDLTGENTLERPADLVVSDEEAEQAVWYEIIDNQLFGLGAEPGVFTGSITPVLFDAEGEQIGLAWEGSFRVLPSKQVVYIKYLPAFSKALEKYGLRNVELEIRNRIMEVVRRDYDGVNVEFRDQPVTDFVEFATIEVGGPDPSGGNKFGYDNTCNVQSQRCKDTFNLYLGDYLGGINAASASEFNTPFGGVFIESFDYFSPSLNPSNEDASPEFDEIMGPFMPALDGKPVRGTEWPGGDRDDEIRAAIKMVGSVIGNTISHEIGHSLGLAFFEADRFRPGENFHNTLGTDGAIMDSGGERPFVERAEIGVEPAKFNSRNLGYLLEILPKP